MTSGATALAELTSEQLLAELASIDRRQQPRRLAALRAELARRGVRYREKALDAGAITPYEVVLLDRIDAPKMPGPLIQQSVSGSLPSWWQGLLLVVLLTDMRRDYDSACRFWVLLQFDGGQYRALCLQSEADYDPLRPNDRRWFVGDWSMLGISGTLTVDPARTIPSMQNVTITD